MQEEKKPNMIVIALIAVLVTVAVSGSVAGYLAGIDTAGMHEVVVYIVEGAAYVFLTISVATGSGYLRNITGYAVKWIKLKQKNTASGDKNCLKVRM